jgi:hypothetical protein
VTETAGRDMAVLIFMRNAPAQGAGRPTTCCIPSELCGLLPCCEQPTCASCRHSGLWSDHALTQVKPHRRTAARGVCDHARRVRAAHACPDRAPLHAGSLQVSEWPVAGVPLPRGRTQDAGQRRRGSRAELQNGRNDCKQSRAQLDQAGRYVTHKRFESIWRREALEIPPEQKKGTGSGWTVDPVPVASCLARRRLGSAKDCVTLVPWKKSIEA